MLLFVLLNGCQKTNHNVVVPGTGVSQLERSFTRELDVYCPSGICRFTIEGGKEKSVVVNMYYEEGLPFKKIEGAYAVDETTAAVKVVNHQQFVMVFSEIAHIQVVDYFRN